MKKLILASITILFTLAVVAAPLTVEAKGGNGKKTMSVCWIGGGNETQANFKVTGSGLIQQHRYMPDDKHLVFKPTTKFSEPEEDGWFKWQYKNQYSECPEWTGYTLNDVFEMNAWYWVIIYNQY